MKPNHLLLGTLALATTAMITACGGGDAATETTISGSAIKGPVKGATVTVTKADGTVCSTPTITDSTGTYSLKTTCTGDLIVEVSGGSYTDEATGDPVNLNQLKAVVAANGGSSTVVVTPLTYLAYITAGNNNLLTSAGYTQAMQALATQFKLSAEEIAATPDITAATANAYGKVLRAFSQYVATQGGDYSLEKLMGEMGDKAKFAGTSTAFAAAFNKINETASPISFSFDGNALVIAGTGSGAAGSLTISTGISGIATTAVTVANIPKPASQADFCGDLQNDSTFQGLNQSGGSLTIKSCSFSGNVGKIAAGVNIGPGLPEIPYDITYTYN